MERVERSWNRKKKKPCTNSLKGHITTDCGSRYSASLPSVFYPLCSYFRLNLCTARVYRILKIFGTNDTFSNAVTAKEIGGGEHHICTCHCFFECHIALSTWFLDLSPMLYCLSTKWIIPKFYSIFSSLPYLWSQVELLSLDIVEYHFSWFEENISLACHFCVSVSPCTQISSHFFCPWEIFWEMRSENINYKKLCPVLTNKTFPSVHKNKDNGSPNNTGWGGHNSFSRCFILPLVQSPPSLTCHVSAWQACLWIIYPQGSVLDISCNVHVVLLSSDVQHRKHDVLSLPLRASHDSFCT